MAAVETGDSEMRVQLRLEGRGAISRMEPVRQYIIKVICLALRWYLFSITPRLE
jgi:hypothetical protein